MGFFGKNKDKQKQTAEELENARFEAESEAKFVAKQEKRNIERTINDIDKSIGVFVQKAAEAKAKGYSGIYQQCIGFIKAAKVRKIQAEQYLFQIDAMSEMKNIAGASKNLLKSMNNVMGTLGKFSLDKVAMMNMQKDFAKVQMELDRQSSSIENSLQGFENFADNTDFIGDVGFSDGDIEAEINQFMTGYTPAQSSGFGAPSGSSGQTEAEMEADLKKLKSLLG